MRRSGGGRSLHTRPFILSLTVKLLYAVLLLFFSYMQWPLWGQQQKMEPTQVSETQISLSVSLKPRSFRFKLEIVVCFIQLLHSSASLQSMQFEAALDNCNISVKWLYFLLLLETAYSRSRSPSPARNGSRLAFPVVKSFSQIF